MTRRTGSIIAAAVSAAALLLTGCGSDGQPSPAQYTPSATARENLGLTMVAWELQTPEDQRELCVQVLTHGVAGTVTSYQSKHGGPASDWTLSSQWLVDTCKGMK